MIHMRPFLCSLMVFLSLWAGRAAAHPHVYVDGGINFVMRDGHMLEALQVTWVYDAFETLYILSAHDLSLTPQGTLTQADMQTLIDHRATWPADFDGSAHPRADTGPIALEWPTAPDLAIIDGRLQMTFLRPLTTPLDLSAHSIDVAFYESTYFFAFEITQPSAFLGNAAPCQARLVKFDPDAQSTALQATLRALGREDIPQTENVGALFADKVVVTCD